MAEYPAIIIKIGEGNACLGIRTLTIVCSVVFSLGGNINLYTIRPRSCNILYKTSMNINGTIMYLYAKNRFWFL